MLISPTVGRPSVRNTIIFEAPVSECSRPVADRSASVYVRATGSFNVLHKPPSLRDILGAGRHKGAKQNVRRFVERNQVKSVYRMKAVKAVQQ